MSNGSCRVSLSGFHVLVNFGRKFVADLAKLLEVGFISSGEAPMACIFVVLVLRVRWCCALGIPVLCKFWVHCCAMGVSLFFFW